MTDAVQRAIQRAKAQNTQGLFVGGAPDTVAPHHMSWENDSAAVRVPAGMRPTMGMQDDTYLPYMQVNTKTGMLPTTAQPDIDLTGVRTAGLDDAQRDELLDQLITTHNAHTATRRDLELERDKADIENKRRFGKLGYVLAMTGGGFFLAAIVSLLALIVYGTLFDKTVVEGTVIQAFLTTFMEVLRTIFTAF